MDCFDERNLEVQFLIRRPLHPAFGGTEPIDEFEQPLRAEQRCLHFERFDLRNGFFRHTPVRIYLENKQIAQMSDEFGQQPQEILAAFGLRVEHGKRISSPLAHDVTREPPDRFGCGEAEDPQHVVQPDRLAAKRDELIEHGFRVAQSALRSSCNRFGSIVGENDLFVTSDLLEMRGDQRGRDAP